MTLTSSGGLCVGDQDTGSRTTLGQVSRAGPLYASGGSVFRWMLLYVIVVLGIVVLVASLLNIPIPGLPHVNVPTQPYAG
jgi:hypothetical protein